jgi:polyhydroxybutyrate depolymerase
MQEAKTFSDFDNPLSVFYGDNSFWRRLMNIRHLRSSLLALIIFPMLVYGLSPRLDSSRRTFLVDGEQRSAIIYPNSAPAPKTGAPLVFVFHGHGGRAEGAARRFDIHRLWTEAVVVYMQGLPGVEGITDPEGRKSGWQKSPSTLGDRDVRFFDIALKEIQKEFKTDPSRVYALGHSNGARFANLLWNMRGDSLAALCSASAQGGYLLRDVAPKSIFMIAGEKDHLVPFQTQRLSIDFIRRRMQADSSKARTEGYARFEPAIDGTEVVTYIHPGGHQFPEEALPMVVSFFQRNVRK